MNKILLAGATGYLGRYILKELIRTSQQTRIIVRNPKKINPEFAKNSLLEIHTAELTKPESISNCCKGIDIVISTVGITKQKDGLTYMDVDYQANLHLLKEAQKSGVKKFIYVSVLNGNKLKHIAICHAKEKFVLALKNSGLDYCIIRPNGFFSDMTEFYNMARKGSIYLFGDGTLKANPIHGEDLAKECVKTMDNDISELVIGGPETLNQNEIAKIAFDSVGKEPKITHIPDWIRGLVLRIAKLFFSKPKFGPIEFFMTVTAIDMVAPEYGKQTLKEYFDELNTAHNKN